jgi:hypothetical protein
MSRRSGSRGLRRVPGASAGTHLRRPVPLSPIDWGCPTRSGQPKAVEALEPPSQPRPEHEGAGSNSERPGLACGVAGKETSLGWSRGNPPARLIPEMESPRVLGTGGILVFPDSPHRGRPPRGAWFQDSGSLLRLEEKSPSPGQVSALCPQHCGMGSPLLPVTSNVGWPGSGLSRCTED